jgi:hypothetical protein
MRRIRDCAAGPGFVVGQARAPANVCMRMLKTIIKIPDRTAVRSKQLFKVPGLGVVELSRALAVARTAVCRFARDSAVGPQTRSSTHTWTHASHPHEPLHSTAQHVQQLQTNIPTPIPSGTESTRRRRLCVGWSPGTAQPAQDAFVRAHSQHRTLAVALLAS